MSELEDLALQKRMELSPFIGSGKELNGVWMAVSDCEIKPHKKGWLFKLGWFVECRNRTSRPIRHEYLRLYKTLDEVPDRGALEDMITRSLDKFTTRKL